MDLIGAYTATATATQRLHAATFTSLRRLVIIDKSYSDTCRYENLPDALLRVCESLQELVWDFEYQSPADSPSPLAKDDLDRLKLLSKLPKLRIHHDHVFIRSDATIEKLKDTQWPPSLLCLELIGMMPGYINADAALEYLPREMMYLRVVFDFDVSYGSLMHHFLDPHKKTFETLAMGAYEKGRRLGICMRAIGGPEDSRDILYMGCKGENGLQFSQGPPLT
ncbi:hypothetical protein NX059_012326 [Plenodomus lindquistii]|nr:hypothetical protein NX059_012326 [Plenodomus lindquistii]